MTIHTRRGRYYDELEVGDVFLHRPGRTVSEAENVLFTTVTGNTQSLHLDEVFASGTQFGTRLVNSLYTLAVVVGLSVSDVSEGTTVANLGFESIAFPKPVVAGDTLFAATEVMSKRVSRSDETRGIVVFEHRGTNQRDEVVCTARRTALMRMRPAGEEHQP
ncbi:MAG TPA: MaoC family dehydratase [Acidimicrobiales bacterium]|nr:MaoC family dehydratase [Acidimicrobiales bacterium]